MQAVKALVARLKATPIGRAYVRYSGANGGLLAGGVPPLPPVPFGVRVG